MKSLNKLFLLLSVVIISSCSSNDITEKLSEETNQIRFTASDFKYENNSRTDFVISDSGAEFKWAENDTVGIFPDLGSQVYFPMASGAGTKTAAFDGGGWALKSSSTYAAYYPFKGNIYLDKTAIPVSYVGQKQVGNNSTEHLGAYDYMAAVASTPENGNVNFQFKHLGALVRLNIPIQEVCSLNSVTLHSDQDVFVTNASLDLTTTPLKVIPVEKSNQYKVELNNLTLSESNQTATVFFMLSPTDISEKNIDILIKSEHKDYQYEFSGKNFKEGMAYSINAVPTTSTAEDAMILITNANLINDFTAHLPTLYGSDITIDWGDGTIDSYTPSLSGKDFTHQYSVNEPTDFEIKITGKIDSLSSQDIYGTITEIKQWGKSRLKSMRYAFSHHPLKYIADDTFGALQDVTDFTGSFRSCSLTAIPSGLFDNCPNVTSFEETFHYCESLTTIPSGLFDNCPNVTSFKATFQHCFSLTAIPSELFDNCPNVTSFENTFDSCPLTTIPSGLFDNCPDVTSFRGTFYYCRSLTTIPSGLFDNCPNVTNFEITFYKCTSLTAIPSGLFDNSQNVTSFLSTFCFCNSLTSIPSGLFDNSQNVKTFENTFAQCPSLTTIPSGLFDNCPNVTSFKGTFYNCTSLTAIPSGLFDNCPNVTSFKGTFYNCTSLTAIPSGLFDNCPNVTNFEETFHYCESLTTIPSGLFDNCPDVTSFALTFQGCKHIEFIPTDIFNNNRKVSLFAYTFCGCINLKSESPYTIINGVKYHLYERVNNPDYFVSPMGAYCFSQCNELLDYSVIPQIWKLNTND